MMNPTTGISKGHGFVQFSTEEEGEAAVKGLVNKQLTFQGQQFSLHITPSKRRHTEAPKNIPALFVRHIPMIVARDKRIVVHFEQYGPVVDVVVQPSGSTIGMAQLYVEFTDKDHAQAALDATHGAVVFPDHGTIPSMAKWAAASVAKQCRKFRELHGGRLTLPRAGPNSIEAVGSGRSQGVPSMADEDELEPLVPDGTLPLPQQDGSLALPHPPAMGHPKSLHAPPPAYSQTTQQFSHHPPTVMAAPPATPLVAGGPMYQQYGHQPQASPLMPYPQGTPTFYQQSPPQGVQGGGYYIVHQHPHQYPMAHPQPIVQQVVSYAPVQPQSYAQPPYPQQLHPGAQGQQYPLTYDPTTGQWGYAKPAQ